MKNTETVTAKDLLDIVDLNEMAKVGAYSFKNDQFEVWVYGEPLRNPSFHFKNKTDGYEVVLTIRDLRELEWKTPKQKIPVQHLRALVAWMRQEVHGTTNWKRLIIQWNGINHDATVPEDEPMPDYDAILQRKA